MPEPLTTNKVYAMTRKKKYIVIIIILMITALLYGYYLYDMPVPSIAKQAPDHVVNPSELISEYELNEEDANQKYLGKVVQLEGQIDRIEDPRTLYIATGNPLSSIIIELEDSIELRSIKEGDNVVLKGVCTGYLMDVVINRAVIID